MEDIELLREELNRSKAREAEQREQFQEFLKRAEARSEHLQGKVGADSKKVEALQKQNEELTSELLRHDREKHRLQQSLETALQRCAGAASSGGHRVVLMPVPTSAEANAKQAAAHAATARHAAC